MTYMALILRRVRWYGIVIGLLLMPGVASADAEIAPAPKSAAEPPAEPSAEPPAEPTLASDDELLPHMERLRVGESPTLLTAPADAPT